MFDRDVVQLRIHVCEELVFLTQNFFSRLKKIFCQNLFLHEIQIQRLDTGGVTLVIYHLSR